MSADEEQRVELELRLCVVDDDSLVETLREYVESVRRNQRERRVRVVLPLDEHVAAVTRRAIAALDDPDVRVVTMDRFDA